MANFRCQPTRQKLGGAASFGLRFFRQALICLLAGLLLVEPNLLVFSTMSAATKNVTPLAPFVFTEVTPEPESATESEEAPAPASSNQAARPQFRRLPSGVSTTTDPLITSLDVAEPAPDAQEKLVTLHGFNFHPKSTVTLDGVAVESIFQTPETLTLLLPVDSTSPAAAKTGPLPRLIVVKQPNGKTATTTYWQKPEAPETAGLSLPGIADQSPILPKGLPGMPDLSLPGFKPGKQASQTPSRLFKPSFQPRMVAPDAVISRRAPVLEGGRISGALRVGEAKNFALGRGFEAGSDLYVTGIPAIDAGSGARYPATVDEGASKPTSGYRVTLQPGAKLGGKVHVRSEAIQIPKDFPTHLPQPIAKKPEAQENEQPATSAPKEQPEGSLGETALGAPPGTSPSSDSAPAGAGTVVAPPGPDDKGDGRTWGAKPPQATTLATSPRCINDPVPGKGTQPYSETGSTDLRDLSFTGTTEPFSLEPGVYSSLTVSQGTTVKLKAGSYTFSGNVVIAGDGRLECLGETTINIGGTLALSNGQMTAPNASRVTVNVLGKSVSIAGKSQLRAHLRAPYAVVKLTGGSQLRGLVFADQFVMHGGSVVAEGATKSDAQLIPNQEVAIAPVALTRPAEPKPPAPKNELPVDLSANPVLATAILNPMQSPTTTDAVISINAPTLNSGRIEGALRVFNGQSFHINGGLNLTGDLLVVGTPTIRLNGNASTGGIVDGSGSPNPSNYQVTLNGGVQIPGKIYRRTDPIALPSDIPTTVPAPTGNRTVNINNANDLANIGAWNTVRDLNVNGSNWVIDVPPGNYGTFTLNSGSRLNFTSGTYNFQGTLNLNGQALVVVTGATTITVGQAFNLNQGRIQPGMNTLSSQIRLNLLGPNLNVNGNSEIQGWVRGVNTEVTLNGNGTIRGQVITKKLSINGGTVTGTFAAPDTQPPTLTIASPVNNSFTASATITVSGTATDGGAGATGVATVKVNGVTATLDTGSGTWSLAGVALTEGPNTISVQAIDNAGNQVTQSVTVNRDSQPPTLTITTPVNNSATQAATVTVSGTATDQGSPAAGVTSVTVNGNAASLNTGTGAWSLANVPLVEGATTLTVRAVDAVGNQTTQVITVIRDTASPGVTTTSPVNNSFTASTTIEVSGTVTDPGAAPSGVVSVTVNGSPATLDVGSGTWSRTGVSLVEGSNVITVQATDAVGNQSSQTVTVIRDTQAPTLTITSPANNSTTQSETITVTGTVADPGTVPSGVASVTVNGVPAVINTSAGTWSAASIALVTGSNPLSVVAADTVGNQTTQTITVIRNDVQPDTTPPTLTVATPAPNFITQAATITVSGTATDPGTNASGVAQVRVNGIPATLNAATWTVSGVTLTEGQNTLIVVATDVAGNETTVTVTGLRDSQPPTLTVTSPANNAITRDATISVTGTFSDLGVNPSQVASITVNGTPAVLDAPTGTWTLASLSLTEGSNTIIVLAVDTAGNQTSQSLSVILDTQPPVVVIQNPVTGSATQATTITVNGTATDPGTTPSGIAQVKVNGMPASYSASDGTWSLAGVSLNEGSNTLTVLAVDVAGNQTEQMVTVIRDTQPPNLTVTSPAENSATQSATIIVSGTVSDPGSNPSGVASVTVNGIPAVLDTQAGTWSLSTVALVDGVNTLTIVATDAAGVQTTLTRTVIRDNQVPTVIITAPADNSITTEATITVTGTATDPGTGASGVDLVTVNGVQAVYTPADGNWTLTSVPLTVGPNTLTVQVFDRAGNTTLQTITVNRSTDNRAPQIIITTPLNHDSTFGTTATITGKAYDEGDVPSGIVEIKVNGQLATYDAATRTWIFTQLPLALGDNLIQAEARDEVGNVGRALIHLTRRPVTAPTISISTPTNNVLTASPSVTVTGIVTPGATDVPYTVTVNGTPVSLIGDSFNQTVTLTEGVNPITAVVTDGLNQTAQTSVTVNLDQTRPQLSVTGILESALPGSPLTISATATDASLVTSLSFYINGAPVTTLTAPPYQFSTLVPATAEAGQLVTISVSALDQAGLSTVVTQPIRVTAPGGVAGYAVDDSTGYALEGVTVTPSSEAPVTTTPDGNYSFVAQLPEGQVRLTRSGFTPVERAYLAGPTQGVTLFDARLTPLDSQSNSIGASGGTATGNGGRFQVTVPAGAVSTSTQFRVTSVSPQGLINLLPPGWSPVPGAVVDIRPTSGQSQLTFSPSAGLSISQTPGLTSATPVTLVQYDEASHQWTVLVPALQPGANGSLSASLPRSGQYAFVVADSGTTAPPTPVAGQPLPASLPGDASSLTVTTALTQASADPRVALIDPQAQAVITVSATSPTQLPSGTTVKAILEDTYTLLVENRTDLVERPRQDLVLYAYPAATPESPTTLGAMFVAKPVRTSYTIAELLAATVNVTVRTIQPLGGGLIGPAGGRVASGAAAQIEIPAGALPAAKPVFLQNLPLDLLGVELPAGFDCVGVVELNLSGAVLGSSATLTIPGPTGDTSRIVVAQVQPAGSQRGLNVVGRATQQPVGLQSTQSAPDVPAGISLPGVVESGRYAFIRVPQNFGYVTGTVTAGGTPASGVHVTTTGLPFGDVTGPDGMFTVPALAGEGENGTSQLNAASLVTDATGTAPVTLTTPNAVATVPVTIAPATLAVQTVTPAAGATEVPASTAISISFNKPINPATITGSSVFVASLDGNPVAATLTVQAGNRSVVLTPTTALAPATTYRVHITPGVKDGYGNALGTAVTTQFTTQAAVPPPARLSPDRIRVETPDADGFARVSAAAETVPSGYTIVVLNGVTGASASTTTTAAGFSTTVQAQVGDELTVIVRSPDGVEYQFTQAAYRKADGAFLVGPSGGTVTSDDGTIALVFDRDGIEGQIELKLIPRSGNDLPIDRGPDMPANLVPFGNGVEIQSKGNFTVKKEIHLSIAAPPGTEEGKRVAFVQTTTTLDENGQEVPAWRPVTTGVVKNGRYVTTSLPFVGLLLFESLVFVNSFLFVITPQTRIVYGKVLDKTPGTNQYRGVRNIECRLDSGGTGYNGRLVTKTNDDGVYALYDFSLAPAINLQVRARELLTSREAFATITPQLVYPEGYRASMTGFSIFRADPILPPISSLLNSPPALELRARTTTGTAETDAEEDPIVKFGVVATGTDVTFRVTSDSPLAFTDGRLTNGQTQIDRIQQWQETTESAEDGGIRYVYTQVARVTSEGSYTLQFIGGKDLTTLEKRAIVYLNFVVLSNVATRPSLPGPPRVLSVSPADKAQNVDSTSGIRVQFSEPVKNLKPGDTILLRDETSGDVVGGTILSGPQVVAPDTLASTIIYRPETGLLGGHTYTVTVTTNVTDTTNDRFDQVIDQSDPSEQPFTSTFTVFEGQVLTEQAGVTGPGTRVSVTWPYAGVIDAAVAVPRVSFYDLSDPTQPVKVSDFTFANQRAFDIALADNEDETYYRKPFTEGLEDPYSRIAAVTTFNPLQPDFPARLFIFNLDDPAKPKIAAIVSLYTPAGLLSTPITVKIHKRRAYIGNVAYRGVMVVDIQSAIFNYTLARDQRGWGGEGYDRQPIPEAAPQGNTFNASSKVQSVFFSTSILNSSSSPSLDMLDQVLVGKTFQETGNPVTSPRGAMAVTYVADPAGRQLVAIGWPNEYRGANGRIDTNLPEDDTISPPQQRHLIDDRVLAKVPLDPIGTPLQVRTVSQLQVGAGRKDVALIVGPDRLWVYDVTPPNGPTAVFEPTRLATKTLAELGITGFPFRLDVDGTLAYLSLGDRVAVVDFSDVTNLRRISVVEVNGNVQGLAASEGYIVTASSSSGPGGGQTADDQLKVSIIRPVAQIFIHGRSPEAEDVCSNPIILDRQTNDKQQDGVIYFQVFGREKAKAAQVKIFRRKVINGQPQEELLQTIDAELFDNASTRVTTGQAIWNQADDTRIDLSAQYFAEVVLDVATETEYTTTLREPIPFSYLINAYNPNLFARSKDGTLRADDLPSHAILLGGNAKLTLTIGSLKPLENKQAFVGRNIFGPVADPAFRKPDQDPQNWGEGLTAGRYELKLKAVMGNLTDEVSGILTVTNGGEGARQPGATVVGDVVLNSGNLALTHTDLMLKTRGMPLALTRSYNSLGSDSLGHFGYGWRHGYQVTLAYFPNRSPEPGEREGGYYTLIGGDGSGQQFYIADEKNGEIQAAAPYHGTLKRNDDGSFEYFTKAQVKYHFDGAIDAGLLRENQGTLAYLEDPSGNRTQLFYDAEGRLERVQDASEQRELVFAYEPSQVVYAASLPPLTGTNQQTVTCVKKKDFKTLGIRFSRTQQRTAWRITKAVLKVNGAETIEVVYGYDSNGNLQTVTRKKDDRGASDQMASTDLVWEYTSGVLDGAEVKLPHRITRVKTPNGHETAYEYNQSDPGAPVQRMAAPENVSFDYAYQFETTTGATINQVNVTDGRGNTTRYGFTATGSLARTTITAPSTAETGSPAETEIEYDEAGLKTKEVDPLGMVTRYVYDSRGNLTRRTTTPGPGAVTAQSLVEQIPAYNQKFNIPERVIDARGYETRYEIHPKHGKVTRITYPTGTTVAMTYDDRNGDLLTVTDAQGLTTTYGNYDACGNPRQMVQQLGSGKTYVTTLEYDDRSRLKRAESTAGPTMVYKYNSLDQMIEETVSDPTGIRGTSTTVSEYTPGGLLTQATRTDGGKTYQVTYVYDDVDRVKRAEENGTGLMGSPAYVQTYEYDAASNLTRYVDRRGVETVSEYNALNHRTRITVRGTAEAASRVTPVDSVTVVVADKIGNPVRMTDLYGQVTEFDYDGLHRMRRKRMVVEGASYTEELDYDANGNVTAERDRNNRETRSTYDPVNRMQTLTDAAGRTRTTTYDDQNGEVRVETAPQGLVQVVRRDGAGRVVFQELTGPDIPRATGTFDYTNSLTVREITETDPRGTVIRRKQSAFGDVAEISVTVSGQEEKTVMAYDAFGALTQMTDAEGRVTNLVTDVLGRVTQATYPGIAVSPGGVVETFVYDGAGNVTRHVDRRGVVGEMTYDQHNRVLDLKVGSLVMDRASYADLQKQETHTDANNHTTTTRFDGLRRPIRITDARNQTVELQYDGENLTGKRDRRGNWTYFQNYDGVDRVRVVRDREGKTSTAEYDDSQRLVRLRDRNGHTRTEFYDALGRLRKVEDEEGLIARYDYDPNGNQVGMMDGRSNRTGMVYDEANRVKRIEHPVVAGRSRQVEQFEYDRVGNVTAYFDGFGTAPRIRYRYNGLNQREEEERTNDQGTAEITRNVYFGDGRLKERTEPKGAAYRTQFEYNDQGSLRFVTDANTRQWEYRYDDAQNLKLMRDPLGREVQYQYDELDRLREVMQPQSQRTQYEYDENGNLKRVVNAKGEQIVTGYFPEDRVQDVQYLTAGGIAPDLGCVGEVFSYDGEGNLQGVREQVRLAGFGQIERRYGMSYDRRDRLVLEWRDSALEPPENPRRRQVEYGYDAVDNVTLVKDDGVTSITYRYDAQNWLEQATLANGVTVNYGWQPNGLVESVTYSNGMSRSFGYDRANRVKLVENRANGLSERFEYDYDLNGNRSAERRYREGTLLRALTFGYDLLDRMQTVTDGTRSISYSYDDVGNRLTETGTRLDGTTVSYTYRYDGANRLQDIQDGTGTVIASYGHDANGNITSITRGNESWSYDYDVREQMVKASRTVTQTESETEAGYYSYDFGKRRIGRNWDADGWTWSVYGQDSVVSEYDSTGSQQNRYEYASGMVVRGEQDGYYFSDAQGSVTFVAGTEPQVTRTEYDPWGVILSGARDGSTISYTGQWRDDQTGLMPLGNGERYYDPLLGRFIQEDSFAGMYTLPISLNRYIYGHDNPLLYVDPTGMAAEMAARGETHELFVHLSNQSGFWNQVGGWGGLALYEFVNTLTLGGVERGDRTGTAYARGEISGGEAAFQSVANISLSTIHLVASAATGGTSLLAEAGIFAGLTAVQQFGIENYEIAYEGRQSLSSLEEYVVNAAFAGGMTIGLGFVGRVANQARVMSQAKTIKEGVEVPHGMLDLLTGAAKKVVHQELALMAQELPPLRQFASRMSPGRQLDVAVERGAGKANKARQEIGCGLKLCFAAGTPVQTRDGQRNIEDLRIGDEVLSYNEQTGQTEYQPITALYAHQNALVLNITVEGEPEPLKVTPEHPFLAHRVRNDLSSEDPDPNSQPKGEWIEAGHLKVGDQLRTATGTWATITDIKAGGSVRWAYNFEVAGNHSYFVGVRTVLTHNHSKPGCALRSRETEISRSIPEAIDDAEIVDPLKLILYRMEDALSPPLAGQRGTALNRAWKQEVELIKLSGRGTRPWSKREIKRIVAGDEFTDLGYTGHHLNKVKDYPNWQGDPRNIVWARQGTGEEHMRIWHEGGTSASQPEHYLIDRQAMINTVKTKLLNPR